MSQIDISDIEYKLDDVKATRVAAADIDGAFRGATIGQ